MAARAVIPTPTSSYAESSFAWNSDKDPPTFWKGGTTEVHPLCVPEEITLSLTSLMQGLGSWDLQGLTPCQQWG